MHPSMAALHGLNEIQSARSKLWLMLPSAPFRRRPGWAHTAILAEKPGETVKNHNNYNGIVVSTKKRAAL